MSVSLNTWSLMVNKVSQLEVSTNICDSYNNSPLSLLHTSTLNFTHSNVRVAHHTMFARTGLPLSSYSPCYGVWKRKKYSYWEVSGNKCGPCADAGSHWDWLYGMTNLHFPSLRLTCCYHINHSKLSRSEMLVRIPSNFRENWPTPLQGLNLCPRHWKWWMLLAKAIVLGKRQEMFFYWLFQFLFFPEFWDLWCYSISLSKYKT